MQVPDDGEGKDQHCNITDDVRQADITPVVRDVDAFTSKLRFPSRRKGPARETRCKDTGDAIRSDDKHEDEYAVAIHFLDWKEAEIHGQD